MSTHPTNHSAIPPSLRSAGWALRRKGKQVRAVNKLLSIETDLLPSELDAIEEAQRLQALRGSAAPASIAGSGDDADGEEPSEDTAHEFKPTTARDGRCSVCDKPNSTKQHRAFTAQQKEREKAGKPKRDASFWREQAAGMTKRIAAPLSSPATFSKELEVELSDADYKAKSRQLAFLRLRIEELQAEKKKTDESYKQRIGGLEEECAELFRSIRRGRDTLELEVYERRDYDRKVVETVRADSHEVVDSRQMQPRELQQPLIAL